MGGKGRPTPVAVFVVATLLIMGLAVLLVDVYLYSNGQPIDNSQAPLADEKAQNPPMPTAVGTVGGLIPQPIHTAGEALNLATREAFETGSAHMAATSYAFGTTLAVTAVAQTQVARALATPTCPAAWQMVDSPDLKSLGESNLTGIAALSPDDIWAVGSQGSARESKTLTLHWDGKQWSVVPSPNNNVGLSSFTAVAAVSASDVWAAGSWTTADWMYSGEQHTLVAHWDGTRWDLVSTPDIAGANGVAASEADDVWVVGPDIMHWDGAKWETVAQPVGPPQLHPDNGALLGAVTALSNGNAWAVGWSPSNHYDGWVALYWDGTQWIAQDVPTRYPGSEIRARLLGAVALSPDDVWAVGGFSFGSPDELRDPIMLHKTATWAEVDLSNLNLPGAYLRAIEAASPNDIWAVGSNQLGPLALHWNGTTWKVIASAPAPACNCGDLNSVAVVSPGDVWAVGSYATGGTSHALIEHLDYSIDASSEAGSCAR